MKNEAFKDVDVRSTSILPGPGVFERIPLSTFPEGASELSDTQPMKQETSPIGSASVPLDPSPREIFESLWTRLAVYGRGIPCGGSEPQPAASTSQRPMKLPKSGTGTCSGSSPPLV